MDFCMSDGMDGIGDDRGADSPSYQEKNNHRDTC